MSNHYHLLLETQEANLSEILHHINAGYTSYFNRLHKRSGHLLQGRYKAILAEKDAYAAELSRYIHLNPARAKMVEKLEEPLTSSLYAYLRPKQNPSWLKTEFVLSCFGKNRKVRAKRYRAFLREGLKGELEDPLTKAYASAVLGSQDFVTWVRETFIQERESRDLPALRRLRARPTVSQIREEVERVLGKETKESRRISPYLAHRHSGSQLSEIAQAFGDIGVSAVSQNTRRLNEKLLEDKHLKRVMDRIEKKLIK